MVNVILLARKIAIILQRVPMNGVHKTNINMYILNIIQK